MRGGGPLLSILALLLLVSAIVGIVRTLQKAGRSGWWVLLLALPLVNLAMVWWFAYARWPLIDGADAAGGGTPPPRRQEPAAPEGSG